MVEGLNAIMAVVNLAEPPLVASVNVAATEPAEDCINPSVKAFPAGVHPILEVKPVPDTLVTAPGEKLTP